MLEFAGINIPFNRLKGVSLGNPEEPSPPGWVKPTGHIDSSGNWRNETQLYDNILTDDTGAYQDKNTIPENSWGDFINLSTAPIWSNKIRVYPDRNSFKVNAYQIDIDVKRDGVWVDVFSGHLSNNVWNEKSFTPGLVTEARIRVYKYSGVWTAKIKEFEFVSQAVAPPVAPIIPPEGELPMPIMTPITSMPPPFRPTEKWLIYQASGYGEVFMYDHNERLRWFPNYETLTLYGYTGAEKEVVPISWFYDKPIGESIRDTKTGKVYPPESTPNYVAYRRPEEVVHTPTVVCPQCKSTLQIAPPSPDSFVTQAFEWLTCPVCGYPELVRVPTGGFTVKIMVRKPWPPVVEPLPPDIEMRVFITPGPEATQIQDALIQYEKKIEELENALKTAKAAELYNSPYATIENQAVKILGQLEQIRIPSPPVTMRYLVPELPAWFVHITNYLNNLKNRVKTLIINCRTAAKERKPIPTYSEEVGAQQDEWITGTTSLLQQRGLPWSSLPFSYLQPGQTAINGRAILPAEEGIPPTWETYTQIPVGIPDYSVEQRMQEASGQEPWELAEALPVAPPKKITPYLILAGLGVTTAAVWYYKKKKRGA